MSISKDYPSEYSSFSTAKNRCTYPSHGASPSYGGAGITFHPAWRGRGGFARFMKDIGEPKPSPQHTIERLDNSRGYEPGNVTWATRTEQNRHKSNCVVDSQTLDFMHKIADGLGLRIKSVVQRYRNGKRNYAQLAFSRRGKTVEAVANRKTVARLIGAGMTNPQIGKATGLHRTTVANIVRELTK